MKNGFVSGAQKSTRIAAAILGVSAAAIFPVPHPCKVVTPSLAVTLKPDLMLLKFNFKVDSLLSFADR